MKKFFILFALLGLVAVSCKKDEAKLTLDKTELTFDANGGSETVTADNGPVQASADQSWCTVTVNATKVIIEVAANDAAERTATVTVSYKTAKATISVKQSGIEGNLDGILSEVSAPTSGGKVSIGTFSTNVEPQVTSPVDWITSEISGNEIFVNVAANTSGDERSAIVSVAAGALKKDVTVKQALDMGVTLKFELVDGGSIGKQAVNAIVELTGSADDFAFSLFNEQGQTMSDEEIIDILKQGGNSVYTKDIYDQVVGQYGAFTFDLPKPATYVGAAVAIAGGEWGTVLTRETLNLNVDPPTPEYERWIGNYQITVNTNKGTSTHDIAILAGAANESFLIDGWTGVSYEETGGLAAPVLFDPETGDLVFVGAQVGGVSFSDGTSGMLYFLGLTSMEGQFYTGNYEMGRAKFVEGAAINIEMVPIQDSQSGESVPVVAMNFLANLQDGSWSTIVAFDDLWQYPMSLTMTKLPASKELKAMKVAERSAKYLPKFYTNVNCIGVAR